MTHKKEPYNVSDVAKYFIYLASKEVVGDSGEREGITNLKLQKILYFAQALFLSKLETPLFKESIEAWEYGPVVPSMYQAYKQHGNQPIIDEKEPDTSISQDNKDNLVQVWDIFGDYSASKLVDMSHAHSPWKDAYSSENKTIEITKMQEYYSDLLS